MLHILKPAVSLINRLRYPQKFVLIMALMSIPLFIISTLFVARINHDINFTAQEQVGLRYIDPLMGLMNAVQHHGTGNTTDNVNGTESQSTMGLDNSVLAAVHQIDNIDTQFGAQLGVQASWQALRTNVNDLVNNEGQYSLSERTLLHIAVSSQIRDLIVQVGNQSNLVLDPDIDTYYLMDTLINHLPAIIAYLSQMQSHAVLAGDHPALADLERLTLLKEIVQENEDNMQAGLGYAFAANPSLAAALQPSVEARQTTLRSLFLPLEGAQFSGGRSHWQQWISSGGFTAQANDTLDASYTLHTVARTQLNALLGVRLTTTLQTRTSVIVLSLATAVLGVYLFTAFYRSIQNTIRALDHTTKHLIEGQPEETLVLENRDELAVIATAFNNIGRELITARDRALQASRVKDEFLATMSHELRTPLNSIIGYTDILQLGMRGDIDDEARELLGYVSDSSFRLLTLINDVLDIAKIEAGRMDMVNQSFRPRTLIEAWTKEAGGLARERQLDFDVQTDDALPTELYGDEVRITQVVMNLLSNAIKFTEKGAVHLVVTTGNSVWKVEISDTGIGIPAHALEYIFDEFRQVDGTSQRAYGGTGLGLAISRKLTMMMGGRIQVKSKVGEGSTFTVTLPLRTSPVVSSLEKDQVYAS